MLCKCGYHGPGNVVHPDMTDTKTYWQCPECKSSKGIRYITSIDIIKKALGDETAHISFNSSRISNHNEIGFNITYSMPESRETHSDYGYITIEEYIHLKKFINEKELSNVFKEWFAEIDCEICKHTEMMKDDCRFIVKRIVGTCKGKTEETFKEFGTI